MSHARHNRREFLNVTGAGMAGFVGAPSLANARAAPAPARRRRRPRIPATPTWWW